MPGRHTRRNPSGPLLSADQLAKVEKTKRGAPANKRWAQVIHDMGPITGDKFDRQFAYYKHLGDRKALKAEKEELDRMFSSKRSYVNPNPRRGGRTRRARMSRRR
jgi:hypothetical protein